MRIGKSRPIVAMNMYVDPWIKETIQGMAKEDGRSMANLVEEIINAYISTRLKTEAGAGDQRT